MPKGAVAEGGGVGVVVMPGRAVGVDPDNGTGPSDGAAEPGPQPTQPDPTAAAPTVLEQLPHDDIDARGTQGLAATSR